MLICLLCQETMHILHNEHHDFIMNIMIPTFLLGFLGLTAFAFKPGDLDKRLAMVLSVLLASLACKSSISSFMLVQQKTSLLDSYVITSYTLLSLAAFESTIVCACQNLDKIEALDFIFISLYGLLWIVFSLYWLCKAVFGSVLFQKETITSNEIKNNLKTGGYNEAIFVII